jgi:asparagine synthase (glutamine-hydrolysing)
MCGICGFAGDRRPDLLVKMASAMLHRGPDDAGTWYDPIANVGLGHRRLSIIDLSASGRQPMGNEDGSVQLVFNGEIYNYRELRHQLLAAGHVFKTATDSEVLVHLYEERGIDGLLSSINGMFAFGLWDGSSRELFLARDHAGIKPLYFSEHLGKLYFASEIKALLRVPELPRRINVGAVSEYLSLLWVGGCETMLEGIHKLEPGQLLRWPQEPRLRTWFHLSPKIDGRLSDRDWAERTREEFVEVVKRQMVSDVPLGAFLSGGLDSSSIVAAMRQVSPDSDIHCYTGRVNARELAAEGFCDDFPYAQAVSHRFRVQLNSFDVRADLTRLLPKLVYHLDEPDADPAAILSYFIAKHAREHGTTVLLSGTGGDEVFYGYRSHVAIAGLNSLNRLPWHRIQGILPQVGRLVSRLLGSHHPGSRRLKKLLDTVGKTGVEQHLALVSWSRQDTMDRLLLPDVLRASSDRDFANLHKYAEEVDVLHGIGWHSHLLVKTFLAAHNLLYTDKTSMAESVEVRVPFLDLQMLRLAASMPDRVKLRFGRTKRVLRSAFADVLPREVLNRSKTGFGVPLRSWVAHDLNQLFQELLSERSVRERGLFRASVVSQLLEDHRKGTADHGYLLYALLNLEIWQRTFIDRPGELLTN